VFKNQCNPAEILQRITTVEDSYSFGQSIIDFITGADKQKFTSAALDLCALIPVYGLVCDFGQLARAFEKGNVYANEAKLEINPWLGIPNVK
jgi:hypothetical protein